MRWPGYAAYYYEAFPIEKLARLKLPLYKGMKTGGMTYEAFLQLKESIENEGLINPIIIERDQTYRIAMGHIRVEAVEQLGYTTIKAVLLVQGIKIMQTGHKSIANRFFEEDMHSLHPGDNTWRKSQWALRVLKSCRQEIKVKT